MAVDRFDPAVCAVCARSATGLGVCPKGDTRKPILWVCSDPTCITDAKNSYDMKQEQFTGRETAAVRIGSGHGGQYLEKIGKAQGLLNLTEPEWNEFCRRIVAGYRVALKSAVQDEAPF